MSYTPTSPSSSEEVFPVQGTGSQGVSEMNRLSTEASREGENVMDGPKTSSNPNTRKYCSVRVVLVVSRLILPFFYWTLGRKD